MKSTSKFASALAFSLIVGAAAVPAQASENHLSYKAEVAVDVQYDYPGQAAYNAQKVVASHSLKAIAAEPTEALSIPQIADVITFGNASVQLDATADAAVKKVAALLKTPEFVGKQVSVNGYTDSVGKAAGNQRLSYHRAQSVVRALVAEGVPASSLSAQGFGKNSSG